MDIDGLTLTQRCGSIDEHEEGQGTLLFPSTDPYRSRRDPPPMHIPHPNAGFPAEFLNI